MATCGASDAAALRAAVERDYAAFAQRHYSPIDIFKHYKENVASWGYDKLTLAKHGLTDHEGLFAAACGGGCPLTLHGSPPTTGETVVDLGCGAGHDVVLAAKMVGRGGRVIGIDLAQQMLDRAAQNVDAHGGSASSRGAIELRRGCLDDGASLAGVVSARVADLVISNGVFNLAADKMAAFRTAFRILKPGGRFHLSDVCRVDEAPPMPSSCSTPCAAMESVGGGWSD